MLHFESLLVAVSQMFQLESRQFDLVGYSSSFEQMNHSPTKKWFQRPLDFMIACTDKQIYEQKSGRISAATIEIKL